MLSTAGRAHPTGHDKKVARLVFSRDGAAGETYAIKVHLDKDEVKVRKTASMDTAAALKP